jgi:DNA repair photolyase
VCSEYNSAMIIKEINAKAILSKSQIFDYTINPYVGCAHGCTYCYARFMKRFTGHKEPWGEFVDVKINAPELLKCEIQKKTSSGRVWVSGVCDPYQPLERKYELTKRCLEILLQYGWPVTVQTRSGLVLRDMDLFKGKSMIDVGLSITTGDESVRRLFEPSAPPIKERIEALESLHFAGIRTYAMIAPMLPGVEQLPNQLAGKVDYVLMDKMNYHYGDWVYRKYHLESTMSDSYFLSKVRELTLAFGETGVECR